MLDPHAVISLTAQCAPNIAPSTLLALVRAESGLDPLAIGVNRAAGRPRPTSRPQAVTYARELIARGYDVDLGLAQINVRNLARLGLSLEDAFDPCRNLAAAGTVLREGYDRGRLRHGPGQMALRVAFSIYNTGHAERGFANGYVTRVLANAAAPSTRRSVIAAAPPPATAPAAWDVFGRAAARRATFLVSVAGATP